MNLRAATPVEVSCFHQPHHNHSSIVTRANLTCCDCIEAQYYSSSLIKFKPVCSHCGGPEETLVEDELVRTLKERKQVVRPMFCVDQKARSPTHGELVRTNKEKHDIYVIFSSTRFFLFFFLWFIN